MYLYTNEMNLWSANLFMAKAGLNGQEGFWEGKKQHWVLVDLVSLDSHCYFTVLLKAGTGRKQEAQICPKAHSQMGTELFLPQHPTIGAASRGRTAARVR